MFKQQQIERPKTINDGVSLLAKTVFPAPKERSVIRVEMPNCSSICPVSGFPDEGSVVVEYVPDEHCIENNAFKYYLWTYRNVEITCEMKATWIARHIRQAISPNRLKVTVNHNMLGEGVDLTVTVGAI